MKVPPRFIVVDDNAACRFLLVKTLLRKFPDAAVEEYAETGAALAAVARQPLTAIVAHRTHDDDMTLIAALRCASARAPIVMVSGVEQRGAALAAGANAFLLYDEWLRIGVVVGELIAAVDGAVPNPLEAAVAAPH